MKTEKELYNITQQQQNLFFETIKTISINK